MAKKSVLQASSDFLYMAPHTFIVTYLKGANISSRNSSHLNERVIFVIFVPNVFMAIGKFYVMYRFDGFGGIGEWLSMGGPRIHNMSSRSQAMHVYVLGRHVHCINHSKIVIF